MSKLERLAMMTPKSGQIGFIPGGYGGLSSVDIANACHGLPNYVFKLLVAKYCFAERDTSNEKEALTLEAIYLISRSLLESGDIKSPDEAGQTAKAICLKFISANRCQCCGGRGERYKFPGRWEREQCRECGGTGRYTQQPGSSLFDVLLSGLYEFESRASEYLRKRLC
ncbi:MAG: hypothetical protein IPM37_23175 [Hahellaceae bacterium]|nr:hypothetical protein [Hahellaceae bacterium]